MIIGAVVIGIDASRLSAVTLTGTERYTREIIAALRRVAPQHCYRLYTRNALALLPVDADENGVDVVPIHQPRLWTHLGLAREISRRPPDVLFIPAHVLPISYAWRRAPGAVVTVHDVGYRRFPSAHPGRQRLYLDWSTAFAARRASALVADSEATRRDVQALYGAVPGRLRVAYPGLIPLSAVGEAERLAVLRRLGLGDGQPFALHVGTLQPRKNLRRLIRAWRRVVGGLSSFPPMPLASPVLVLAGAQGWGGEDLQAEAGALGLGDRVRFTGYITDAEKSALMRSARVFVFPSLYEGFGLPVLEAQSAGLPVVCSNTSSLPEVAGESALLVDPLDEAAIADALMRVMCDDATRARLIQDGLRNTGRFSWDDCARVVLRVLEDVAVRA